MTKSYVLYKCGGGRRRPVSIFSAQDVDEAREAPTWLRRRHPGDKNLDLGPGEFFEILEQGQCPPEQWQQAVDYLARHGGSAGS